MTTHQSIVGIYDFELFPFALGDVLTWNVRTAMRCQEAGRRTVDIYACVDERYPAGVHQRDMINAQNFDLFFSELYSAFGTHPCLGDIHIFRNRDALVARLREIAAEDPVNREPVRDYLQILGFRELDTVPNKARRKLFGSLRAHPLVRKFGRSALAAPVRKTVLNAFLPNEEVINNYFTKYIASHETINAHAASHGGIPLLQPALGCAPDVDELIERRFAGRKIVAFHLRLRRLDAGYKGEHSYSRDSDFLEWYDFLRRASVLHPEVEFIALGRLQEKPLELLRLPNVTSLRMFGLGLGHELTMMLRSHLFIGTSSGFAALANFSSIPYFVTRMNPGSCRAYDIPEGAERLPFARPDQKLVYATETAEMLMGLLRQGLDLPAVPSESVPPVQPEETAGGETIDVYGWLNARLQVMNSAATTSRFFDDERYRRAETAYLLYLSLERARQAILGGGREEAAAILARAEANFPSVCRAMPQFSLMRDVVASSDMDRRSLHEFMEALDIQVSGFKGAECAAPDERSPGWRPMNWAVSGTYESLSEEAQPALRMKATAPSSYWHTEAFASASPDGRIVACFDAANAEAASLHQMYIFEDGVYRPVGQIFAEARWQSYEVPITARPGSVLELQVDQPDASQWFSIRNFRVTGAVPLHVATAASRNVPMAEWEGGAMAEGTDIRRWSVAGARGHLQSPILAPAGSTLWRVSFSARTDRPSASFSAVYMFEGSQYRHVAQFAFGPGWRQVSVVLQPQGAGPLKVQVDYPEGVEWLELTEFRIEPVERSTAPRPG